MEATEARVDRGKIKQTMNSPHVIDCSNGKKYVVKPRATDKQFANEVLAIALARVLDIPHADAAFVAIDDLFRSSSPEAAQKYIAGVHFGSEFESKSWTFDNPAPGVARAEISNLDDLYKVVAFDELVANTDRRGNPGNNMVVQVSTQSPRYKYVAIDHGHIFTGHNWTAQGLQGYAVAPILPLFPFVQTCLTSLDSMLQAARTVTEACAALEEAVAAAKSDLSESDRGAVVQFLQQRAKELPAWVQGGQYRAALQNLQP